VPARLVAGLAAIVSARWCATTIGIDPLLVGVGFGLALASLASLGRTRSAQLGRGSKTFAIGVAFGFGLVAIVLAGSALGGTTLVPGTGRPASPFVPWAAITILVASAEEVLLRGRLFDVVRRAGGVIPAVLVTTVAFALMHVPLYGWHVVPLDLAVGLGLGGLRLATGGVTAPAAAHAVADLATWWL